jgi:deoxyguanosine kinase
LSKYPFIVIEGNIGVGKTSLAKSLSEKWNYNLLLEEFERNEFLHDFYLDASKVGFQTELRFILDRFNQLKVALEQDAPLISDYFIEKSLIFAENSLSAREFTLFKEVYDVLFSKIRRPDLYVYLNSDVNRLRSNILKRDRKMEHSISIEYLDQINKGYLKYVSAHKDLNSLVIDTSKTDFIRYPQDLLEIEQLIQSCLPQAFQE